MKQRPQGNAACRLTLSFPRSCLSYEGQARFLGRVPPIGLSSPASIRNQENACTDVPTGQPDEGALQGPSSWCAML